MARIQPDELSFSFPAHYLSIHEAARTSRHEQEYRAEQLTATLQAIIDQQTDNDLLLSSGQYLPGEVIHNTAFFLDTHAFEDDGTLYSGARYTPTMHGPYSYDIADALEADEFLKTRYTYERDPWVLENIYANISADQPELPDISPDLFDAVGEMDRDELRDWAKTYPQDEDWSANNETGYGNLINFSQPPLSQRAGT